MLIFIFNTFCWLGETQNRTPKQGEFGGRELFFLISYKHMQYTKISQILCSFISRITIQAETGKKIVHYVLFLNLTDKKPEFSKMWDRGHVTSFAYEENWEFQKLSNVIPMSYASSWYIVIWTFAVLILCFKGLKTWMSSFFMKTSKTCEP